MDLLKELPIPKGLRNCRSDYVSWTSFDEKGTERGKWKSVACYGNIMRILPQLEIHCRPYPRGTDPYDQDAEGSQEEDSSNNRLRGRLSPEQFQRFFELARAAGLVPPGVTWPYDQTIGQSLLIPREGWDRHTLYITLCLYRYCDYEPRSMFVVLTLCEHGWPFLQALHYVLAQRQYNCGHCFLYAQQPHSRNPALGAALVRFARMTKEERAAIQPRTDYEYTYNLLADLAAEVGPTRSPDEKTERYWAYGKRGVPSLLVDQPRDLLSPLLTPVYTDPTLTTEDFQRIMEAKPTCPTEKLKALCRPPALPEAAPAAEVVPPRVASRKKSSSSAKKTKSAGTSVSAS